MTDYLSIGSTETIAFPGDDVPAAIAATPAGVTVQPDPATFTFSTIVTTVGGRVLETYPGVVTWELVSGSDITLDTDTGEVSEGVDGASIVIRPKYDDNGADIHLVGDNVNVACSVFSGMSAAAAAILEGIRVGLSDELTPIWHLVPGLTDISSDPTDSAPFTLTQDVVVEGVHSIQIVDDEDAIYGKALVEQLVPGPNTVGVAGGLDYLTVDDVVRGCPTRIDIVEDISAMPNLSLYYPTSPSAVVTSAPSPATSGLSLTVDDASAFSSGGVALAYPPATTPDGTNAEIINFSRSGNVLTIERAQNGSTARSIANGWIIHEALGMFPVLKWYNGNYSSVNTVGVLPGHRNSINFDDHTIIWLTDTSAADDFVPSDPACVVRLAGGSGSARIDARPDQAAGSFLPSAVYSCWRVYYSDATWLNNDGSGSIKGLWFAMSVTPADFNGGYNPGAINDTTDPVGFIKPTMQFSFCDLYNGDPVDPPNTRTTDTPDVGRGPPYTKIETIIRYPATPTDSLEEWMLFDGVEVANSTFRVVGSTGSPVAGDHFAWRLSGSEFNNTYGGVGARWPTPVTRRTAEIYVAGGFADPDEEPDHFELSIDGGLSHPAGSLITLNGVLQDANDQNIDQLPGWDYVGTYQTGYPTPDFTITGDNGAVREGGVSITDTPAWSVPVRLSMTPGPVVLTVTLYRRANNYVRVGDPIVSTIELTAT